MKKIVLFVMAVAVTGIFAVTPTSTSHSNIAAPEPGYSGAPGDFTCNTSGCHTDATVSNDVPTIILESLSTPSIASGYSPNETYNLVLKTTVNNSNRNGFQITALDASGNPAGTLAVVNTTQTSITTGTGGREYIGHKNATSVQAFNFRWTAPASGDVYFYAVWNKSNVDSTNQGDALEFKAYKATTSSFAPFSHTVGIAEVADAADAGIILFPNPVSDVLNIAYNVNGKTVKAEIYSLSGQLVKPLFQEQANGPATQTIGINNELATGIYLVKFNVGEQVFFKKILVQ